MKLTIFLFIFISFIPYTGRSQPKTDSLLKIWKNTALEDTARLSSLLLYLKESNLDSAETFGYIDKAKVFAERKDLKEGKIESLITEAEKYIKYKTYIKALQLLDEALSLSKKINYKKGIADAELNTGLIFFYQSNFDKALIFFMNSKDIYTEINDKKQLASVYGKIGASASNKGDNELAHEYLLKAIKMNKQLKNLNRLCADYSNLGNLYQEEGDFKQASESYLKSLEIAKQEQLKHFELIIYSNLFALYSANADYKKALEFANNGLRLSKKEKDTLGIVRGYINLGNSYFNSERYDKALSFFNDALKLSRESNNNNLLLYVYTNIGSVYQEQKKYNKALEAYNNALLYENQSGYKSVVGIVYSNIANTYLELLEINNFNNTAQKSDMESQIKSEDEIVKEIERNSEKCIELSKNVKYISGEINGYLLKARLFKYLNKLNKSLFFANKAFTLSKEKGFTEEQKKSSELLYELYTTKGNFKKALEFHEEFITLRDSLNSIENEKALIQQEYRSQYERQAEADSIKHAQAQKVKQIEIERQKAEIQQKKIQQYALFAGIGLMLLFALYILKKNKEIKEQKLEIEKQKSFAVQQQQYAEQQREELHEQHKQIKDSINYAQTLQKAVLPSFEDVNRSFPQNFVFFQPKDVVSGDFFWTYAKENLRYLAVVDCTGHGVPGAFMTIVANNILNEIVQENFTTPKDIVSELHKRIKIRIGGHKDAKVRDSMDLALLSYDYNIQEVLFVGTHMSLYLVRNGELFKYKGSKADIGYSNELKLIQHTVQVQHNDMLYMHTDGYPDQKGGENNKKFYYQPIRKKMQEIYLLNLDEQMLIFKETFNKWKEDKDQLDDVTVVGVRI